MKLSDKNWKVFLASTFLFTLIMDTDFGRTAAPSDLNDLKLVWADEFNKDGPPDPKSWMFEEGFVRNEELQWYQPDNAICRDGLLIIEGRREQVENSKYDPAGKGWKQKRRTANFTSSCLKTSGRFGFQYGILEVRARMDAQPGMWPAIWTLGENRKWPGCGEVDLFEYYDHSVLANACWADSAKSYNAIWDGTKRPLSHFGGEKWAEEFHIWKMVWDQDKIVLKLDEEVLNTIDLTAVPEVKNMPHPFRQKHYILLNLAIGGRNGGDVSKTRFPSQFLVDYVRVYQREASK